MSTESDFGSDDIESAETADTTDAIELLTIDHEEMKQLFAEYDLLVIDDASDKERAELAVQICDALTAHTTAEEEIFYPAARDAIDDSELVDEAIEEHASAMALITRIRTMDAADELYDAAVRLLQEAVEQHVLEEEGELFPRVRKSSLDLQSLGEEIALRKEEVLAELLDGEG